jgi:hypothetical protein
MNKKLFWVVLCIIMVACFTLNSCFLKCDTCDGSGICQACNGRGYYQDVMGYDGNLMRCEACGGSGKCQTCNGTGW